MSDKQWHGHYPEPLRKAPVVGMVVYIPCPDNHQLVTESEWAGDEIDALWLQRGRLHLTSEAAEAHARFEIEQAGGVV